MDGITPSKIWQTYEQNEQTSEHEQMHVSHGGLFIESLQSAQRYNVTEMGGINDCFLQACNPPHLHETGDDQTAEKTRQGTTPASSSCLTNEGKRQVSHPRQSTGT